MIPTPAALQIFSEVWSEYSALVESDPHSQDALNFIMDVQLALKTLYPTGGDYAIVHDSLLDNPRKILPATRCALGDAFLLNSLWPVRNYFQANPEGK